jgi:hypothetical protein
MESAFQIIEPEVAGGWGPNTVATRTPGSPVVVQKLHYQFDGWLGDELLESTPCFIATEKLAEKIQEARLTGANFEVVQISTSSLFREMHPAKELPPFVWLQVHGKPGMDDFGLSSDLRLVISNRAYAVIQKAIGNAAVTPFSN